MKQLLLVTLLLSVGLLSGCTKCTRTENQAGPGQDASVEDSVENTMEEETPDMGDDMPMGAEEGVEVETEDDLVKDEDPAADAEGEMADPAEEEEM